MSYASIEELAAALRIAVTPANSALLQACLEAAAVEIDASIDRVDSTAALPAGQEILAGRVNLVRAVEWFKSNDAAFGVIGTTDTGSLTAPRNGFNRHRAALRPIKQQYGIG